MKKNKIISLCMAAVMAASAIPMPAFAASIGSSSTDTSVGADTKQNAQTQYTEIAESNTQTQVYLSVDDSDLIVSLPTTIILSGTPNEKGQYIGNYSIGVKGEMSGDRVVNISPDNTNIQLKQVGKEDKTATITQEQTEFTTDDFKNNTKTTGTVTVEKLSAGSWNSSFNFDVRTIKLNRFYSSLNLAAQDINEGTVNTKNTVADLLTSDNAVCGVYKYNDTYRIEVYKDVEQQSNLSLEKSTAVNLNNHKITFSTGNFLTYIQNFSICDGTLNGEDANYIIFSNSENLNSSFEINNIIINQTVSENISTLSYAIDTSSSNIISNNLTITQTGTGNSAYQVAGFFMRNSNETSSNKIENYIFNSTIKNSKSIKGLQASSNCIVNSPTLTITSNTASSIGIYLPKTALDIQINSANINISANSPSTASGIYGFALNTNILNSIVYVGTVDNMQGSGISIFGAEKDNQITNIEHCTVFGKEWGINTSYKGQTTIKNSTITSTDHTAYICGNSDIYDSEFYITERDKFSKVETPFGLYLGHPKGLQDYTVNFTRCKINNGTQNSLYTITAKTNDNYIPPKNVNFYDCELYRTVKMSSGDPGIMFSYNYTNPNSVGKTKFNLYGTTKLLNKDGTEIDKQTLNTLSSSWKQSSTLKYTGKYDKNLIGNIIAQGYVGDVDEDTGVINSIYLTDDAGIYDYRS